MNRLLLLIAVVAVVLPARFASADSFGSGGNSFAIDFVTIGQPNNPADTTGSPNPAGSLPYVYRIGKYEISEQMIEKANLLGGLGITKDARGPDKPATSVSWFEAAQFVNWLNTSAMHTPAYKFDSSGAFQLWQPGDPGYDPSNLFRNSKAKYFLPSANEWYKAAYYDPAAGIYYDYATGSNAPPLAVASGTAAGTAVLMQDLFAGPADITQAGGLSPYGTIAQAGNVDEWEETSLDLLSNDVSEMRGRRGTGWGAVPSSTSSGNRFASFPSIGLNGLGFRVVSAIPEPSTGTILLVALSPFLAGKKRGRSSFLWTPAGSERGFEAQAHG